MPESDRQESEGYRVVLDGHGTYSCPYLSRDNAQERADELNETHGPDMEFSVVSGSHPPKEEVEEVQH